MTRGEMMRELVLVLMLITLLVGFIAGIVVLVGRLSSAVIPVPVAPKSSVQIDRNTEAFADIGLTPLAIGYLPSGIYRFQDTVGDQIVMCWIAPRELTPFNPKKGVGNE